MKLTPSELTSILGWFLDSKIWSIIKTMADIKQDLLDVKADLADTKAAHATLKTGVVNLAGKVVTLTQKVTDLEGQLANANVPQETLDLLAAVVAEADAVRVEAQNLSVTANGGTSAPTGDPVPNPNPTPTEG